MKDVRIEENGYTVWNLLYYPQFVPKSKIVLKNEIYF